MFVVESRHARRLVARIDRGEDVIASLKKLCQSERIRAGWLRATGHLEWAELVHWDPEREAETRPRRIGGPLLALALEGNVSTRLGEPDVVLRGSLSRETDAGVAVVGGQLASASALALEVMIEALEDARLDRDEDPPTGLSLWKGERTPGVIARGRAAPAPAVAPPPVPALASAPAPIPTPAPAPEPSAWAQVAAISADVEKVQPLKSVPLATDEDEHFLEPKKGDWVEHRQFGLCRVDGEDAEGALVIRLPNAQRKHIRLDVMDVLPPRHDGDRRIFPIRPRVKR
jgi:predicted DNA-binding protein with PD1-like motif